MDTIRRVRAARGATNMSLEDFANAIGVGKQTQVRTENGTRTPKPHEFEAMARESGLPVEFFYVEDLADALGGAVGEPPLRQRVEELIEKAVRLEGELRNEQRVRGNLERALQEVLGEDLKRALDGAGPQ